MATYSAGIGTRIVEEIANREDVDPVALDPPLGSVVDPDALETLVASENGATDAERLVRLSYHGYDVTVRPGGDVVVE